MPHKSLKPVRIVAATGFKGSSMGQHSKESSPTSTCQGNSSRRRSRKCLRPAEWIDITHCQCVLSISISQDGNCGCNDGFQSGHLQWLFFQSRKAEEHATRLRHDCLGYFVNTPKSGVDVRGRSLDDDHTSWSERFQSGSLKKFDRPPIIPPTQNPT